MATTNFDPIQNGATPVTQNSGGFDPAAYGATPVDATPKPDPNASSQTGWLQPDSMTLSPFFQSNPSQDNGDNVVGAGVTSGLKTLGNLAPSAVNTAVGLVKSPIEGLMHIGDIPQAYNEAVKASGGLGNFAKNFAAGVYENVMPKVGQGIIKAIGGQLSGNPQAVSEGLDTAQKSVTEDPIGQILPFFLIGREVALKISPEAGVAFDNAVSTVGKPVVNGASWVGKKTVGLPSKLGTFALGQATGLDPATMSEIKANPSSFSHQAMATIDRPSVASGIKTALDVREEALSETGQAYQPMRDSTTAVVVDHSFLKDQIEKTTGVTISEPTEAVAKTKSSPAIKADKGGEIQTSGSAIIRDPKDVRALQNFYNTWQPYFDKGEMTPNEFLNMRTDLAKLSKFDREISKSGELEAVSKGLRANLNNEYRSQIQGLEDTDATYSSQITELENLRKGILDKNGELTDASINKIANAANKGRTVFANQLEEISPGIIKKVKILKAIEDIQTASGHKVATYTRSTLGGAGLIGGIMTGSIELIAGALAEMALANPDFAVPMLRAYGWNKNLVGAVLNKLKSGVSTVNQLPQGKGSMSGLIPRLKTTRTQ